MKNDIVHSIVEIPGFGVIWSDSTSIFVFRKWYYLVFESQEPSSCPQGSLRLRAAQYTRAG